MDEDGIVGQTGRRGPIEQNDDEQKVTKTLMFNGFEYKEESKEEKKEEAKGDPYRFACFLFFLLFSIIGVTLMFIFRDKFFYQNPPDDFNNWPRFVYSCFFVIFGYSLAIYISSRSHSPQPNPFSVFGIYFSGYLITAAVLASIVFVIFSAIDSTSSYLYYYITAAVGTGAGFTIDFAIQIHDTLRRYLSR